MYVPYTITLYIASILFKLSNYRIYEIEKKIRTPERFRFPAFETINWYAAKRLCEELKMINDEASKVPQYLLLGVKALLFTLKQWSQDRDVSIPITPISTVRCPKSCSTVEFH